MIPKFCDCLTFTKRQLLGAYLILNMDHRMTFTFISLGTRVVHSHLSSWFPISRMQILGTNFWKHCTIDILPKGGLWWKILLGYWKILSKNYCWKSIFAPFSFLMLLHVAIYCIIYDIRWEGCGCRCVNVTSGTKLFARWNKKVKNIIWWM